MNFSTLKNGCCSFFMILLMVVLFAGATSIYAQELELEGNILNDADGPPDAHPDWEDIFDVNSGVASESATLPAGYGKAVFIRDFEPGKSGPDISTFATGSKDTLNITPGWECTRSNNVNDKTDVVNAYATVASEGGDVVVYFALERYSNEGDGNVGFWFLKDGSVGCDPTPKTGSFTGNHQDGDVLIVSEFSGGGKINDIVAYRWIGGAGGYLDPTPIAAGGECTGNGYGDNLCAIVNASVLNGVGPATDIPWLTETKQPGNTPSNDLDVSEFFEGRINLTQLNLLGCFSKYMAVTRSSTSLTATIFDYALGDFPLCSIDVVKKCSADTSYPRLNTAGDKILSLIDVVVTNDGISTIHDVAFEEDLSVVSFNSDESCKVVAIDGSNVTPTDVSDGTPYVVAASLTDKVTATLLCETDDNPFANAVVAKAKSVSTSNTRDLTDKDTMSGSALCPQISPNPMIKVTKTCPDVDLIASNDLVAVQLGVDITVENTGLELLKPVVVANTGLVPGSTIPITHVDSGGNPLPAFDGELSPGEKAYFRSVYTPNDTDGTIGSPDSAQFTDQVKADGKGAISGSTATATATATCKLCPDVAPQ